MVNAQREPVASDEPQAATSLKVLRIQRTCVHDGPGVRTTIFFQGCNLRCLWCQNPEALGPEAETEARPDSLEEILEIVLRDERYYAATGGGVTLSGGDPLVQPLDALVALLHALKERGLHVTVETSLHAPRRTVLAVAPLVDLFLVDLKVVGDDALHRQLTGKGHTIVQSNLRELVAIGANLRFRMVVVPGHNDSERHLQAVAQLLHSLPGDRPRAIELLKYHEMHEEKARRLAIARPALGIGPAEALQAMNRALRVFAAHGITATCDELGAPRRQAVFSERVYAIRDAIRESDYHLCFESARLKTQYYRKHGFDAPTPIHRAERLRHLLRNKALAVYPRELLVGNFTSYRRGAQLWEEHYGVMWIVLLHWLERLEPVSYHCTLRDRVDFYTDIFPFWARHGLMAKVVDSPSVLLEMVGRCADMNVGFNNNMAAIAHFVVNFERLLALGTTGLREELRAQRRTKPDDPEAQHFYEGATIALQALEDFAERYREHLTRLAQEERVPERRRELEELATICARVPRSPARTFHEALQSMLFLQIALCMESYENAVSFGRLDQILQPYFERDREAGRIDYDKAKELLALFILKMDEAILVSDGDSFLRIGRLFETQSTDQTVTAGGLARDGRDATNDVTWMLLDICELQPLAVNMTARVHKDSPPEYLERLAEVYLTGAPMPALYNDHVYVDTLTRHYPTSVEDARDYAVIGCVEPNASADHYGNTDCANMNVTLPLLQALKGEEHDLWHSDRADQLVRIGSRALEHLFRGPDRVSRRAVRAATAARARYEAWRRPQGPDVWRLPRSMDELLARYQARMNALAQAVLADHQAIERKLAEGFTTPLASTLFEGCVESGRDVYEGGATLNSSGIQAVGVTDAADSLHALEVVVFERQLFPLEAVLEAMENDFEGPRGAAIRAALLAVPKFGDDSSPAPARWMNVVLDTYVEALRSVPNCPRDGIYAAGYYALNVSDIYGKRTPALPSGRLRGQPLANSLTPHYGMPQADLLSALHAVAALDYAAYAPNGTTVTFTVDAALFQGAAGVHNLAGIIKTYFDEGGMQFQPNVVSRDLLLEAYEHPDKHPYLLVRVAGYCAYFNDLSDDLKKIIISRTCYS